uniref:Uncharacterized protein n=1 Tax=uncultured Desulfobacterium sp. TaxID=201089 RepID=E1YBD5_9BACT|nr:unknown protein [uncultured Desulfobacterium sp.]
MNINQNFIKDRFDQSCLKSKYCAIYKKKPVFRAYITIGIGYLYYFF